MIRLLFSFILFASFTFCNELEYAIENTNIITYNKNETKDYNRLRVDLTLENIDYPNTFVKLIADNENIYSNKINSNDNSSSIYRGYFQYVDDIHLFSFGLQRIPFGVGHIWNPIDIFNPTDSTAIEIAQREGTKSIRYEYAINSVSNLDITYSKDKSSFRIKSYLDIADIALIYLKDNDENRSIYGYEFEGELFSSGIEFRSEGGYFKDNALDKNYYKYIAGVQYGFENSLTLLTEFHHNTNTDQKDLGLNISYTLSPLLYFNILGLYTLTDQSYMTSSTLEYSLADDITISYGYFNYQANNDSDQYGDLDNTHFLKLFISF